MHEFSIALNIVDLATEYAGREGASRIREVEIEVGTLSGVVIDALEFALESAVKGTLLDGAELRIEKVEGRARCSECSHVYPATELYSPCPECGGFPEIINGREMRVRSLIVDD